MDDKERKRCNEFLTCEKVKHIERRISKYSGRKEKWPSFSVAPKKMQLIND